MAKKGACIKGEIRQEETYLYAQLALMIQGKGK